MEYILYCCPTHLQSDAVILHPILGGVETNATVGFVPVAVDVATHGVSNVIQKYATAAFLGKNIVLTLSTRSVGRGVATVTVVMVDGISNNFSNTNNDASYYINNANNNIGW